MRFLMPTTDEPAVRSVVRNAQPAQEGGGNDFI